MTKPALSKQIAWTWGNVRVCLSLVTGGGHVRLKRTPPPESLDADQQRAVISWCKKRYPKMRPRLRELWEDMSDYYMMKGEDGNQLNWEACFRRWIRRAANPPRYVPPERGSKELPAQVKPTGSSEMATIHSILSGKKEEES